MEIADKVVDAIIQDLTNRRGLRQEWDQIDPDIKAEIRAKWVAIVDETAIREIGARLIELNRKVEVLEKKQGMGTP